ncbi:MAG: hypothetical protein ACE5K8_02080 [Candidatus Zixiibacteriota bacterium]
MEEKIRYFLQALFGDFIIREDNFRQQQSFYIKPDGLVPICAALLHNKELDVWFLADITPLDWLGHE